MIGIGPVATAARHLIAAGVSGSGLVQALAEIEAALVALLGPAVIDNLPESYRPRRSSGAMRTAKWRARKAGIAVTGDGRDVSGDGSDVTSITSDGKPSQTVTCDARRDGLARINTDSSSFLPSIPEISVFEQEAARHQSSPPSSRVTVAFETFIAAYPGNEGMSRSKAQGAWNALTVDDQAKAFERLPAFKAWLKKQAANYTILHAHNYLSDRRFDSLGGSDVTVTPSVFVRHGTPAWQAWEADHKARGKRIPRHGDGWRFPSEFPPDYERQQMAMRLLRKVS